MERAPQEQGACRRPPQPKHPKAAGGARGSWEEGESARASVVAAGWRAFARGAANIGKGERPSSPCSLTGNPGTGARKVQRTGAGHTVADGRWKGIKARL